MVLKLWCHYCKDGTHEWNVFLSLSKRTITLPLPHILWCRSVLYLSQPFRLWVRLSSSSLYWTGRYVSNYNIIQLFLVWLLLYAHRHQSILGAAGHIILTPANQLMVMGLKIWSLSNPGFEQRTFQLLAQPA
jgi:hypothetical protein